MGKHVNAPRLVNIRKALEMSGYDDVSHVGITTRPGYEELRIDSHKVYATALANPSVVLNTLRFAEKAVSGIYGKAIIGSRKAKNNNVSRVGCLAHIPL